MNTNKVVLDFTQINSRQEVAMMPANLAKKLLKEYAQRLTHVGVRVIVQKHIDELIKASNEQGMTEVLTITTEFLQERQLIEHISNDNWGAYAMINGPCELPNME